jgi:hypothetical protein
MHTLEWQNGLLKLDLSNLLNLSEIQFVEIVLKNCEQCLRFSREQLSVFVDANSRLTSHLPEEKTLSSNKRSSSNLNATLTNSTSFHKKERRLIDRDVALCDTHQSSFDVVPSVEIKSESMVAVAIASDGGAKIVCSPTLLSTEMIEKSLNYISPCEREVEWDDLYCTNYDSSSDPDGEIDTLIDSDDNDSLAFSQTDSSDVEDKIELDIAPLSGAQVLPIVSTGIDDDYHVARKAELKDRYDIKLNHLKVFIYTVNIAHAVRQRLILSNIECLFEEECKRVVAVENDVATALAEGESSLVDLILHHKQVVGATDNAFQHHCSAIQARQEAFVLAEEAGEIVACLMSGNIRPDSSARRAALVLENVLEMETLVKFGRSDLAKLRARQLVAEQRHRSSFMTRVADMKRLSSIAKEAHRFEVEALTTEKDLDGNRVGELIESERARILAEFVSTLSVNDTILFNQS